MNFEMKTDLNPFAFLCIFLLGYYLCCISVFLVSGCSTEARIIETIPGIKDTAVMLYDPAQQQNIANTFYSAFSVCMLSVLLVFIFALPLISYFRERAHDGSYTHPSTGLAVVTLCVWLLPAYILNTVGRWAIANQDVPYRLIFENFEALNNLLLIQEVAAAVCVVIYAVPLVCEIISYFRHK